MDSILNTIKKLLGIDEADDSFNIDVMVFANNAIFNLSQIGVGPKTGFMIMSEENTWSEYIDDGSPILDSIKNYLFLKTKMVFDPPTSSTVIESFNAAIKELEWRMMLSVETNNLTE